MVLQSTISHKTSNSQATNSRSAACSKFEIGSVDHKKGGKL